MKKLLISQFAVLLIVGFTIQLNAQNKEPYFKKQKLQVSLIPGLSTNGNSSSYYTNLISINLLSGISGGNMFLEIGGLSNFNLYNVNGIQISGLFNIIRGNLFSGLSPSERNKFLSNVIKPEFRGVQLTGISNIIDGSVKGFQVSGGLNFVKNSLEGIQTSGLFNMVYDYSLGIQIAALSNVTMKTATGIQFSLLNNYCGGKLNGIQMSSINQALEVQGKEKDGSSNFISVQLGLINSTKKSKGIQIGIINYSEELNGTQIGLINFSKKNQGVPIGLLNISSKGEFCRYYANEMFSSNLELSTGSLKVQNSLLISYNPFDYFNKVNPKWALGYGLGKIRYTKSGKGFLNYDFQLLYLNPNRKFNESLGVLAKLRMLFGKKLFFIPGVKVNIFAFGGVSFNSLYRNQKNKEFSSPFIEYKFNIDYQQIALSPGGFVGLHFK